MKRMICLALALALAACAAPAPGAQTETAAPATAETAFSTRALQAAQLIPVTENCRIASSLTGRTPGAVAFFRFLLQFAPA